MGYTDSARGNVIYLVIHVLFQVKMMENMASMDEESFDAYFSDEERTWTTVLSGGDMCSLRLSGADQPVLYHDRLEYAKLVQEARLHEADRQVEHACEQDSKCGSWCWKSTLVMNVVLGLFLHNR